jgi:predicted transcriptional regulator
MSDKVFSIQEDLTEEYQQNFKTPGVIGYFKNPHIVEPKKKTYYLLSETGELTLLGKSLKAVDKRLKEIYYADQIDFWDEPSTERNTAKMTPKRQALITQVSKIKTWGRGVIAKIAANLGRKIGAVRQMLSVLTKIGLLVRIRRGQYAPATNLIP